MQTSKYQIYSHSDMRRVTSPSYQILSNFGCSGPLVPSGAWSRKLSSFVYLLYLLFSTLQDKNAQMREHWFPLSFTIWNSASSADPPPVILYLYSSHDYWVSGMHLQWDESWKTQPIPSLTLLTFFQILCSTFKNGFILTLQSRGWRSEKLIGFLTVTQKQNLDWDSSIAVFRTVLDGQMGEFEGKFRPRTRKKINVFLFSITFLENLAIPSNNK